MRKTERGMNTTKSKKVSNAELGGQNDEVHFDKAVFAEQSGLLLIEATEMVDAFFADEDALYKFLYQTVIAHREEYEANQSLLPGKDDEGTSEEPSVIGHLWTMLLLERFLNDVRIAVDKHMRPILQGYSNEELDELCEQIVSKTIGEILMQLNDRIQAMDVLAFLERKYQRQNTDISIK